MVRILIFVKANVEKGKSAPISLEMVESAEFIVSGAFNGQGLAPLHALRNGGFCFHCSLFKNFLKQSSSQRCKLKSCAA